MKFLRGEYTPQNVHTARTSLPPPPDVDWGTGSALRRLREPPSDAAQKETQTGRLEIITLPLLPPLPLPPPSLSSRSPRTRSRRPRGTLRGGRGGDALSPLHVNYSLGPSSPRKAGGPLCLLAGKLWPAVLPQREIVEKIEKGLTEIVEKNRKGVNKKIKIKKKQK